MRERGMMFSGAMVRAINDGTKTQTRRACKLRRDVDFIGAGGRNGSDWDDPSCWGFQADDGTWWVLQRGPEAQPWQQPTERELPSPYGEVGDRLWVRETFGYRGMSSEWLSGARRPFDEVYVEYIADGAKRTIRRPPDDAPSLPTQRARREGESYEEWSDYLDRWWKRSTPAILMPRWVSRTTLEITGRRVERLHDITDEDIRAEGVTAEAVRALLGRDTVDLGIVSANGRRDPRSVVATPIADLSLRELWQVGWTAINGAESWASNPFVRVIRFRRVEATS